MIDLTVLTDPDLDHLRIAVAVEQDHRRIRAEAPHQVDTLIAAHAAATGRRYGDPWKQPTSAVDAYPQGAKVVHGGKAWVSLTPANVWQPGVSGWREEATGGAPPAWVQPTGAHDAYPLGAKVTHKSKTWTSTTAANVWEPGVYGWTT